MGVSWSPDPSSGDRSSKEEGLSAISGVPSVFAVDSDDDDDRDENAGARLRTNANDGYELLGDNDNVLSIRDDDDSEHDDDENDATNQTPHDAQSSAFDGENEPVDSNVEPASNDESVSAPMRDIIVDYDQVRAVMAGISLPPSAVPSWASSVPDSEWCSLLQNRIRNLQEQNEANTQSKNEQKRD